MIKIKQGLDLPISGAPVQVVENAQLARSVAVIGYDYPGLKPTMEVKVGDKVVTGQLIFTDKKTPGISYTAPASGTVTAINRGKKRVFESLVIDVEGDNSKSFDIGDASKLDREAITRVLIDSGEWTAFKTRPFGRVPGPDMSPADIFVTAMDTRPLAPDPGLFIAEHRDAFAFGLDTLAKLTDGKVYVCSAPEADLPAGSAGSIQQETFSGPHPAGLAGTHIHFLSPVSQQRTVWSIGYQDLIAIGYLFQTGKVFTDRVVSLAGPGVTSPRLFRTRRGANLEEMTAGELESGHFRVISGSVFDGRKAAGSMAFLGRHHNQVSVLKEGTEREFIGFLMPGSDKFSLTRLFASSILGKSKIEITTSTGGSNRAMVPLGTYEEVMPLDILPTQLLRALLVEDLEYAISLGCLELDEEDLALCTFACPGKYEYGPYLREMLDRIEAEG